MDDADAYVITGTEINGSIHCLFVTVNINIVQYEPGSGFSTFIDDGEFGGG